LGDVVRHRCRVLYLGTQGHLLTLVRQGSQLVGHGTHERALAAANARTSKNPSKAFGKERLGAVLGPQGAQQVLPSLPGIAEAVVRCSLARAAPSLKVVDSACRRADLRGQREEDSEPPRQILDGCVESQVSRLLGSVSLLTRRPDPRGVEDRLARPRVSRARRVALQPARPSGTQAAREGAGPNPKGDTRDFKSAGVGFGRPRERPRRRAQRGRAGKAQPGRSPGLGIGPV